jgi:hypothetical protein
MEGWVMHRTQVLLEDQQYAALRDKARREGKSMGQLIREFVERGLTHERGSRPSPDDELTSLKGIIHDPDLRAGEHDEVLYGKE